MRSPPSVLLATEIESGDRFLLNSGEAVGVEKSASSTGGLVTDSAPRLLRAMEVGLEGSITGLED